MRPLELVTRPGTPAGARPPTHLAPLLAPLLATILATLSGACGGAPAAPATTEHVALEEPAWRSAEDPVSAQMREIAARLEAAGLVVGGPTGQGFLTARGQETQEITVARGRCATIVALTSRGIRDLDATLFAPSGDVLAEDVEPDAHPAIQVCAPASAGRRFYYSLTAYEGVGTFVYASFLGPRESFGTAASVLGGQPGVVGVGEGEGGQDLRMHEWTEGVARRGFTPVGSPVPVVLATDQRVRVPLGVELGHCYTVVALATPGLQDIDLRVLDDAGQPVVLDESPSKDASVQLCATRTADYAAEVHAVGGRGEARVAIFEAEESRVGGVSGLWLGEPRDGERARRDVESIRDETAAAAVTAGWRELSRVGGSLESGGAAATTLTLPADRCSLLVADGGRGLGRVVLRVTSRTGQVLAHRGGDRSSAAARICPAQSTEVTVALVSRRGEGRFVITHFAKALPDTIEALGAEARGRVLDALEEAAADGYRLAGRATMAPGSAAVVGSGTACARWNAVDHAGSAPVVLTLSRGGEVIDQDAGAMAQVASCAPRGDLTLEVAGGTSAAVEVMRFER